MARRIHLHTPLIQAVKTGDKPLSLQVADRLTDLIADEAYRGGHKLPNEYELAERLGVGRSTVREAIKILVSRNVLEVRHGSGTFVREGTGVVDDPLGFKFYQDKRRLAIDLCDIRLMLEPALAAAAAKHADKRQMEALERICDLVEKLYRAEEDHGEADVELHKKIAEASGNVVAPGLVGIISTAIPLFIDVTHRSLREETISTHRRTVEAIRARQPRAAEAAMREHLEHNRANFLAQAKADNQ